MRVTNNLSAITAFNSLNSTNEALTKTINALSTGLRINSASDDAAGFAVSEKMRSQIRGLETALRNSQDGISLLQTAEGALGQTNSMLQRMRELTVQASNDSLTSQDRSYIQLEINQLKDQIDRIANTTQFNNKRILDGSSGALWSSNDSGLKARINGGLTYTDNFGQKVSSEGNYRIEIKAEAGDAQVQKSNVMLIKHKNVTMNRTINRQAGINNVSINDVPAGDYTITSEAATEAHAIATSSYGLELDELAETVQVYVSQNNLRNNASILFEVTAVDELSGDVTLSAVANVLKTDGTTETYRQDNIRLSEGQYVDLSTSLGLGYAGTDSDDADGAFELRLQSGMSNNFSAGDKFVYNLNVAKDIEGADRCVKISGDQNPSWPDGWQETMEIQTSNSFEQPAGAVKARVLFVIDDSGSMSSATANLANNLGSFIQKIADESVEEVSVGVASYSTITVNQSAIHRVEQHMINGNQWSTVNSTTSATSLQDIRNTLNTLASAIPSINGYSVDHYHGIGQAINDYGLLTANNVKNYIVLLTDTGAESLGQHGISRTDVKQLLTDSNSELITICPTTANSLFQSTDSTQALVTMSATNPGTSDWSVAYDATYSSTGTWGTTLSNSIGPMIGINAVQSALFENVPLYEFPQLQGVFPSASSSSQVITIHQGDKSYDITINPDDTFETLNNKLNQYTGASTTAEVVDLESGKKGIRMITSIPSGERVTYSGNQELLTQLGLRSNFDHKFSLDADKVTDRDIHFRTFYLNKNTGHVHEGDIVLSTNSTEIPEYDLLTSFEAAYIGQIPKHDVKLTDINNFWNTEGVFIVDQPKTITITQGNGKTASVTLYKTDTLDEVRDKLNNAIANDLGQSKYTDSNKFVSYVKEGEELKQGDESVAGTFIVRSAVPGKSGELYFSGDDEILRALGLNTIHESSESRFTASVYNAHSGTQLATGIKATGNVLTGIIPNVDIEFDAMAGIKSSWDENTKRYFFTDNETYSATLHLRDNGIIFQTGANKGEDFTLQLGDTSCSSLGIVGVNVASRNNASHSIGVIDRAINRISSQRAKIGAFINGLEHTMTNLITTTANLTSAESRIRDADMSKTMMEFVKLQVLNQSGTSMLAQANQLPRSVLNLIGG